MHNNKRLLSYYNNMIKLRPWSLFPGIVCNHSAQLQVTMTTIPAQKLLSKGNCFTLSTFTWQKPLHNYSNNNNLPGNLRNSARSYYKIWKWILVVCLFVFGRGFWGVLAVLFFLVVAGWIRKACWTGNYLS